MESGIKNSFIPHDAKTIGGAGNVREASFLDLVILVSAVLFVASAVAAAGVFVYQQYLETNSKSKFEQLKRAKDAFQPALVQELTRLDDRMREADLILGNHIAPSALFHMLEDVTLTTVAFRSLAFQVNDAQNITAKMDGIAQSVNSIALQADIFSKNGMISSPLFSNIDRQQDGVHFDLSALVSPSALRYSQLSSVAAATPQAQEAAIPAANMPQSPFETLPAQSQNGNQDI